MTTPITLRVMPLPTFGLVAGHALVDHGVYLGDIPKHADRAHAHISLHRGGIPADHAVPHIHPEMADTPVVAPDDIAECDWCEEPIGKGEPVWWHIAGFAHAWHPGERPC